MMHIFESQVTIMNLRVGGDEWTVRVERIYNPSAEEIAEKEMFNHTLGNYEPDHERPTEPQVDLLIQSEKGETFSMHWMPKQKLLGPHIRRRGWERGIFNQIKSELLRWRLEKK